MSALALKRTLLTHTSQSFRTANLVRTPFLQKQQTLYKPLFNPRFVANMSDDTGVHNLKGMEQFKAEVVGQKDSVVVLDCYATWCGPCKVIAPQVVKFSQKYKDVKFFKLDVDESPDVAQELGVRAMPTFYIFKNGEKVADVVGANPAALESAIAAHAA